MPDYERIIKPVIGSEAKHFFRHWCFFVAFFRFLKQNSFLIKNYHYLCPDILND